MGLLIIATVFLTYYAIIHFTQQTAMHRNMKIIIGFILVTYQVYVAVRLLSIIFILIGNVVPWLTIVVNIARVWCALLVMID